MQINLHPTVCNLCGGEVIYTSNAKVYGREYGSGKCYYCTKCHAYVGTHKPRPKEALGLLADKEMRDLKMQCHTLFDKQWKTESTSKKRHLARKRAYKELAKRLSIPVSECHFGYFDMDMLKKTYVILQNASENVSEPHTDDNHSEVV
jgi:hypothetical protein